MALNSTYYILNNIFVYYRLIWRHSLNNNVNYWIICTCNDRYCFYCGGFVTSISLSFNRKSSFGFGILNFILTFCRPCMVISFCFDILLGFLISGSSILFMCLMSKIILTFFWWFPLFIYIIWFILSAVIYITIVSVIIYICVSCIQESFIKTFGVIWWLFNSLPLLIRIRILIYIFIFAFGQYDSYLDYTLNATGGGGNNLPISEVFRPSGNGSSSGSNGPAGHNLPPIREAVPEIMDNDPLYKKCAIQLRKINSHETNLPIFHRNHTFDCAILEQSEKEEFLTRYARSGDQACKIVKDRLVYRTSGAEIARMNSGILDAIRRGA